MIFRKAGVSRRRLRSAPFWRKTFGGADIVELVGNPRSPLGSPRPRSGALQAWGLRRTSDTDDFERQLRQSLKRLEAELARTNGITAEKQNDEQASGRACQVVEITAEKQSDRIAYLFGRVLYWICFIVAGGLAACGFLAGIVKPKNWADFNFYLLFAVPAVGFLGIGIASRYTQVFLKLLMRLEIRNDADGTLTLEFDKDSLSKRGIEFPQGRARRGREDNPAPALSGAPGSRQAQPFS